jgi:hypothetical protein
LSCEPPRLQPDIARPSQTLYVKRTDDQVADSLTRFRKDWGRNPSSIILDFNPSLCSPP